MSHLDIGKTAASKSGYEPQRLKTDLRNFAKFSAEEQIRIIKEAIRFIDAEGRAVELATIDTNAVAAKWAIAQGLERWHHYYPSQYYNFVEAERRALNDGESGLYDYNI